MRLSLEEARMVGAVCPLRDPSPFDRGRAVLSMPGGVLVVHRYPSASEAEGRQLDDDEWERLVESGDAHALKTSEPAWPNGALWVFREDFLDAQLARKDLEEAGALARSWMQDGATIALVDEGRAGGIRRSLAQRAFEAAWKGAKAGDWPRARRAAIQAVVLSGMVPDHLALLALVLEENGEKGESDGYLGAAKNSLKPLEYERLIEKRKEYADDLARPGLRSSHAARPGRAAAAQAASKHIRAMKAA